mmetsp:Transcript_77225/g.249989  ORF Transcript_77225/g.249989 Transcript_77225/m.249989 type:complete len:315 (-) Transcript_77225:356-1300(-)
MPPGFVAVQGPAAACSGRQRRKRLEVDLEPSAPADAPALSRPRKRQLEAAVTQHQPLGLSRREKLDTPQLHPCPRANPQLRRCFPLLHRQETQGAISRRLRHCRQRPRQQGRPSRRAVGRCCWRTGPRRRAEGPRPRPPTRRPREAPTSGPRPPSAPPPPSSPPGSSRCRCPRRRLRPRSPPPPPAPAPRRRLRLRQCRRLRLHWRRRRSRRVRLQSRRRRPPRQTEKATVASRAPRRPTMRAARGGRRLRAAARRPKHAPIPRRCSGSRRRTRRPRAPQMPEGRSRPSRRRRATPSGPQTPRARPPRWGRRSP